MADEKKAETAPAFLFPLGHTSKVLKNGTKIDFRDLTGAEQQDVDAKLYSYEPIGKSVRVRVDFARQSQAYTLAMHYAIERIELETGQVFNGITIEQARNLPEPVFQEIKKILDEMKEASTAGN